MSKIRDIVKTLYPIIEGLTCESETSNGFQRWRSLDDLSLADASPSWRGFRINVTSTGKGTLQSGSETRSKMAKVSIAINYPKAYFSDDDLVGDALGIEVIRAEDDATIVNRLCFTRPMGLQDAVEQVRSLKWLGSSLQGRLWVISLELEYLESTT